MNDVRTKNAICCGTITTEPSTAEYYACLTETEPSMNSLASQAMPFLRMLWRQKWIAVGIAWLVCTVGWIGVAFMPTKYESSTRIYLNADPLLTPLLRGLAIDTDPSRHLDFLQRTLLSRPNLEQLVRLTDLDIHINSPAERETLFRRLAAEVSITPITSNLMTISYRNKDPQTAKNVVQGLLTIFAEKTAGSSRVRDGQCPAVPRRRDRILS